MVSSPSVRHFILQDGSDDTMQRANTSSPPLDGLDRLPSATYTTGSGGRSHSRSTHQGVPIPGARTAPLKVQRPSRSLSSPLLASELLASSCPSGDRPVRSAARRSMVVTAAALRDDEDYGSDSEISEEIFGGGSYNVHASLSGRRGGSLPGGGSMRFASASASGSKKKHNPWTMEETLALVEGVRLAGVGKWAEIKRLTVPGVANVLDTRSAVDLKDKWRNLTRVARLPKAALRARLQRGPSDVPLETMLLVKELMDTTGAEAE